jgi:hypothetical protein
MSTVHPTAVAVNTQSAIYQSIYHNPRSGRCEATVITDAGFQRLSITPDQFQAIAARLRRFVTADGPTCVHFDTIKQIKERK